MVWGDDKAGEEHPGRAVWNRTVCGALGVIAIKVTPQSPSGLVSKRMCDDARPSAVRFAPTFANVSGLLRSNKGAFARCICWLAIF
jgi:hypothetical protein